MATQHKRKGRKRVRHTLANEATVQAFLADILRTLKARGSGVSFGYVKQAYGWATIPCGAIARAKQRPDLHIVDYGTLEIAYLRSWCDIVRAEGARDDGEEPPEELPEPEVDETGHKRRRPKWRLVPRVGHRGLA